MNDDKQMKFLADLLQIQFDSEIFAKQIGAFSQYLVYSNSGYYYNETYLKKFCSEFITFQKFVQIKNEIFMAVMKSILNLTNDLNLHFSVDQFWNYFSKDNIVNLSKEIDTKQICKVQVLIKCSLIYKNKQYLFLKDYDKNIKDEKLRKAVSDTASKELMEWIEEICNEKEELF